MVNKITSQINPPFLEAGNKTQRPQSSVSSFADQLQQVSRQKTADKSNTLPSTPQPLLLGHISEKKPTVSQLLFGNDKYAKDGWDIIFSEVNQKKPYTRIPQGTAIYLNPATSELNWSGENSRPAGNTASTAPPAKMITQGENDRFSSSESHLVSTSKQTQPSQLVRLGRIDSNSPTVSHLLQGTHAFNSDKWNILASEPNKNKDFTKIPGNAEVFINKITKEITWGSNSEQNKTTLIAQSNPPIKELSGSLNTFTISHPNSVEVAKTVQSAAIPDLTEAVQPYLGRSYKEINCYNLLVKGLTKMGLPYTGKDGLRNKLTTMAREKGLPSNAYLNGEGIVKAAGKKLLSHSYRTVSNPTEAAGETFDKMANLLQKGQILSFSTPTKGHTGIISQHEDQWTFINSGRMDNPVINATSSKEVGEESLFDEVKNWFKTANENSESLVVTLGQLEEEKIRNDINPNFKISRRL